MKPISQKPGLKAKPGTPQSLSTLAFFLPIYKVSTSEKSLYVYSTKTARL